MAKSKDLFGCNACGTTMGRWAGRCPSCGEMNSIVELNSTEAGLVNGTLAAAQAGHTARPLTTEDLSAKISAPVERLATGSGEMDRVLGGGLPAGAAVVLGGAPGVGKSTLLAQCCGRLAASHPVLYITAEESLDQVRDRCHRLGLGAVTGLELAASADADAIAATVAAGKHRVLVIDSIQMLVRDGIDGVAGTPSQVRGCANLLVEAAKRSGSTLIIVGHVTKDGTLAGPRLLEHLVDTVLAFEGDHYHEFRCLRAIKNRFGSTDELGLLRMESDGLHDVSDAGACFISDRNSSVSGSCIAPVLDGKRCLLVEVQALVNPSDAPNPLRRVSGCDTARVTMICAVLSRRLGLPLAHCDVFVNATGGVQVREPAADLAIAMAICSAWTDIVIPADIAIIGEVGLGGELRPAPRYDTRAAEARRLGFKRLMGPGKGSGKGRLIVDTLAAARDQLFADS